MHKEIRRVVHADGRTGMILRFFVDSRKVMIYWENSSSRDDTTTQEDIDDPNIQFQGPMVGCRCIADMDGSSTSFYFFNWPLTDEEIERWREEYELYHAYSQPGGPYSRSPHVQRGEFKTLITQDHGYDI